MSNHFEQIIVFAHCIEMPSKRNHRGGDLAGNPSSAWGWTMGTLGNGYNQFMNSLSLQPGQSPAAAHTNVSVPQSGGRKRSAKRSAKRRTKKRKQRGGSGFMTALSQAAVPAALVAGLMYKSRRKRKH